MLSEKAKHFQAMVPNFRLLLHIQ